MASAKKGSKQVTQAAQAQESGEAPPKRSQPLSRPSCGLGTLTNEKEAAAFPLLPLPLPPWHPSLALTTLIECLPKSDTLAVRAVIYADDIALYVRYPTRYINTICQCLQSAFGPCCWTALACSSRLRKPRYSLCIRAPVLAAPLPP
ncbi:hypothetical protein HPB52_021307 [Rhipicephalus sanguineus]|uniref:Uncharacterized protein n=1 Tax=Rhipicephalus sanguineus TaxID=34632 RepID=A0A9D4PDN7_RHISA|nr:hypothetical protein HPB52_021307 [Rhipicephalus sanguineus]